MHPSDQAKIAFLVDQGAFYYKVMSFELKSARAIYQRLVNNMFAS